MKTLLFVAVGAVATAMAIAPPAWLYPSPAGPPPAANAGDAPVQLAGSAITLKARDIHNRALAVDWFPDPANPPPAIVLKAGQPGGYACGYCHLPQGQGRPENATLAGLSD